MHRLPHFSPPWHASRHEVYVVEDWGTTNCAAEGLADTNEKQLVRTPVGPKNYIFEVQKQKKVGKEQKEFDKAIFTALQDLQKKSEQARATMPATNSNRSC